MNNFSPLSNTVFPPVVKNLLIINGIMFLATYVFGNSLGINLNQYLALYAFNSDSFRIWQLVTHLFMHGDMWHIFGNMLALWMFGASLENLWGSKRFLNYYILTGIGAAIFHLSIRTIELNKAADKLNTYTSAPSIQHFEDYINQQVTAIYQPDFLKVLSIWEANPNNIEAKNNSIAIATELYQTDLNSPTIGASGAVFGILLAFGMLFPNVMIYVYFFLPIKAKYFVILYSAFELFNGFANNPGDNVAHFAHLGGMIIGFLLIKIWKIKRPDNFF
ncbi:MAG: rhomboid family intramembrane serine protease [Sphingobacteriales bacterium]|nr:MAG: rhomboid family intramembrane serine protease [Sphingobacteriales bacterium]TAF79609.1 MAG: rhomboid family intramembrane serine protease [Sphingobacteriales bacterium]